MPKCQYQLKPFKRMEIKIDMWCISFNFYP